MFAKNGNVSGQTMPAKMTITKYRTKLSACEPANSASSTGLSPALIATISARPKTSFKTCPQNGACTSNRSFFSSAKYTIRKPSSAPIMVYAFLRPCVMLARSSLPAGQSHRACAEA